jgi:hypothetical protein
MLPSYRIGVCKSVSFPLLSDLFSASCEALGQPKSSAAPSFSATCQAEFIKRYLRYA